MPESSPPTPELITIADAAVRCACSEKSIRRWISEGRLEAVRLGPRLIRIPAASLDALSTPVGWAGASR